MTQQHPAGWYDQPDGSRRFWDGSQWTNQVVPSAGAPQTHFVQQRFAEPKKAWFKKKRVIIPAAVALVGIAAIATGGDDRTVIVAPATSSSVSVPAPTTAAQATAVEMEPSPSAEAPSEEPTQVQAPAMTVAQQQAARKAQAYLAYSAFSRSGLIEQLEFEGFSYEDAQFGVDNLNADWMEQAALKARDYLNYSAFSRSGLIEQLMFEGFSLEEAEHGATAAGL